MNMNHVFENVKESFCSLWTFKLRGKTLEIITPFSTTTFKFISLFITERDDQIIVTDGGWLTTGEYLTNIDWDDDIFLKIYHHYESLYEIRTLEHVEGLKYYFKSTSNIDLVPNLVYDMCHFLSAIISTSQIPFQEQKEKEERENFRKLADSYLAGILNPEDIQFRKELGENYKNVRFNAILTRGTNRISLIKYITGSTPNYFINSLTKATVDFEIANHSPLFDYIDNRIAFVNDKAPGYDKSKIYRYMETLEEHTKIPSINWSTKESLLEVLNN